MSDADLHDLTLSEAAGAIERRELSPVAYTEALIARSEALQPSSIHSSLRRLRRRLPRLGLLRQILCGGATSAPCMASRSP